MKYFLIISAICLFLNFNSHSQGNGINWMYPESWESLKKKAKTENKYIFLDCYATWCYPCKKMDKEIYISDSLTEFAEQNFISVKVQLDTSNNDNVHVQKWYADAHKIKEDYNVRSLPSFLFFSPEGKLVHRDIGYKDVSNLLFLFKDAVTPSKQNYILIENYRQGKADYKKMPELIKAFNAIGERKLVKDLVLDYKKNYLDNLPDDKLLTRENIGLIVEHNWEALIEAGSMGRIFQFFYQYPDSADKIMDRRGFAFSLVKEVIKKEEVENKLWSGKKIINIRPDWEKIHRTICQKYSSSYSTRIIIESQLIFYRELQDWKAFANVLNRKIENSVVLANRDLFDFNGTFLLNWYAWDVFLNCNDRKVLKDALKWIELAIKTEKPRNKVQYLDTRANLLYKLGKVNQAIEQELKAIQIDSEEAIAAGKERGGYFEEYSIILSKMRKGEPTWIVADKK